MRRVRPAELDRARRGPTLAAGLLALVCAACSDAPSVDVEAELARLAARGANAPRATEVVPCADNRWCGTLRAAGELDELYEETSQDGGALDRALTNLDLESEELALTPEDCTVLAADSRIAAAFEHWFAGIERSAADVRSARVQTGVSLDGALSGLLRLRDLALHRMRVSEEPQSALKCLDAIVRTAEDLAHADLERGFADALYFAYPWGLERVFGVDPERPATVEQRLRLDALLARVEDLLLRYPEAVAQEFDRDFRMLAKLAESEELRRRTPEAEPAAIARAFVEYEAFEADVLRALSLAPGEAQFALLALDRRVPDLPLAARVFVPDYASFHETLLGVRIAYGAMRRANAALLPVESRPELRELEPGRFTVRLDDGVPVVHWTSPRASGLPASFTLRWSRSDGFQSGE